MVNIIIKNIKKENQIILDTEKNYKKIELNKMLELSDDKLKFENMEFNEKNSLEQIFNKILNTNLKKFKINDEEFIIIKIENSKEELILNDNISEDFEWIGSIDSIEINENLNKKNNITNTEPLKIKKKIKSKFKFISIHKNILDSTLITNKNKCPSEISDRNCYYCWIIINKINYYSCNKCNYKICFLCQKKFIKHQHKLFLNKAHNFNNSNQLNLELENLMEELSMIYNKTIHLKFIDMINFRNLIKTNGIENLRKIAEKFILNKHKCFNDIQKEIRLVI